MTTAGTGAYGGWMISLRAFSIEAPGVAMREVPVFAGGDVGKADFVGRVTGALEYLIFGPS